MCFVSSYVDHEHYDNLTIHYIITTSVAVKCYTYPEIENCVSPEAKRADVQRFNSIQLP
jgi:hypothetical protein